MRRLVPSHAGFFHLLIVLSTFLVLSFTSYTLARQTLLQNWQAGLSQEIKSLAFQIGNLQTLTDANLVQISEDYALLKGISLVILSNNDQIFAQSSNPHYQITRPFDIPEAQSALAGNFASNTRQSGPDQHLAFSVAAPILSTNHVIGAVLCVAPISFFEQTVLAPFTKSFLAASIPILLIAISVTILLNRMAAKPLNRLTQSILARTRQIVSSPSPTSHLDEYSQLDYAFSHLTSELNLRFDTLRLESSRLEAIMAHMTDGIVIADTEGDIQMINRAAQAMFDTQENAALGHSLAEVIRFHQLVDLWKKCQSTRQPQTTTLELAPDYRFIHGIVTILQQDGMPEYYLLVFQDLTRLRKLEMVRRDFVSNVSHELRTPLASLKALTETLSEGALEDPPAARRFLLRMENEIDNLTQMVQELLELSRIESGRVPLEKKMVAPVILLRQAMERMQLQAERAHLTLLVDIQSDLPQVLADPPRIGQVLINLIHNAIKFTPPGGRITLSAYSEVNQVVFSVTDTGVGIEEQALQRIFERFYKADRARSGGGTGLGLSIAKHMVESHGGHIWAISTPGQGSTFYFSLPVKKQ